MSIIDKIKKSVEALGLAFMYGSLVDLNDNISAQDLTVESCAIVR